MAMNPNRQPIDRWTWVLVGLAVALILVARMCG